MLTENKQVLIVARTYPTPALKGVEVSCTAGVSDGQWIRLFPLPYRFLEEDQRFKKYQLIDVKVQKATNDVRPESYRIFIDTITIKAEPLLSDNYWQARKQVLFPLKSPSLCHLVRQRNEHDFPTLGFFKPKLIRRLVIEDEDQPAWTDDQLQILGQGSLFDAHSQKREDLEKIPFRFRYQFECDDSTCTGHTIICTDWEMGAAWWRWSRQYGSVWESKFRQRFEIEMIQKFDTHFVVGTVHGHPQTWIIIGLFYPLQPQGTLGLFDELPFPT